MPGCGLLPLNCQEKDVKNDPAELRGQASACRLTHVPEMVSANDELMSCIVVFLLHDFQLL